MSEQQQFSWPAPFTVVLSLLVTLSAAGCSCSSSDGGPCEGADAPAGCGEACGPGADACPSGLYCASGECRADCMAGTADSCPSATQRCTPDGQCVDNPSTDASADTRDPNVCADVVVEAARVTPTVILVVDQSGSMTEDFGGETRWDALKSFLLADPAGLIASLEDQVDFGLALYSAVSEEDGLPIGECPRLTQVSPAPNNFDAIASVYGPADVIDETPTGDAIDAILDSILDVPDPSPNPTILIVATDGEPDRCEELNPQNGQEEAVTAVERAFGSDIRTFMISVGEDISRGHMQDMANAGLGLGAGGAAEYWIAGDDATLRRALEDIVGGVLSCDVTLEGAIEDTADACTGTVRLNGRDLVCDDADGWEVTGPSSIRLLGAACDELTTSRGAILEASFPCDVVLI